MSERIENVMPYSTAVANAARNARQAVREKYPEQARAHDDQRYREAVEFVAWYEKEYGKP